MSHMRTKFLKDRLAPDIAAGWVLLFEHQCGCCSAAYRSGLSLRMLNYENAGDKQAGICCSIPAVQNLKIPTPIAALEIQAGLSELGRRHASSTRERASEMCLVRISKAF